MGIYGALATAVTGMRAQAFALENISGNIANSQTTGYKRLETGFVDLIPDAAVGRQVPGAVLAYSRSTNDVRGDIITSPTGTHVALNGSGFFIVSEKVGTTDGTSIFGQANYYTRRGDFEMDREGYLVNGAGYYLRGVPIDPATGNVAGSVPEMVRISNGLIPANATSRVQYQLNLPAVPAVGLAAAPASGVSSMSGLSASDELVGDLSWALGEEFTVAVGGGAPTAFVAGAGSTLQDLINWVNTSVDGASASLNADGQLIIRANRTDQSITFGGDASAHNAIGIGAGTEAAPAAPETGIDFLDRTVEGGAITVYAPNGASVNVQMRWGKVSNEPDTWQLYYMGSSTPTVWNAVPQGEFTFNSNGTLATMNGSTVSSSEPLRLEIAGLTINGTTVGDVELDFGVGGLTQFHNANGRASVTQLAQNGYAAGAFMSVAVNDAGRVVATYSNGEQIEIFQLVTANFNAENMLKRLDGGLYAATAQSGEAILSLDGGITGGALESSNTDISEEFTKLIVTQQAYAAGTRIVSTSDEMLKEALNMVR